MQDKDCRKNEISYIALLPVAPPLDEIDQRQKHQVRYNLIRMYAPFFSTQNLMPILTPPLLHTDFYDRIPKFYIISLKITYIKIR